MTGTRNTEYAKRKTQNAKRETQNAKRETRKANKVHFALSIKKRRTCLPAGRRETQNAKSPSLKLYFAFSIQR